MQFVAFAGYVAALVLWTELLLRGARRPLARAATWVSALAVALHALAIVQYALAYGELPLAGLGPVLSTSAFAGGLALVALLVIRNVSRLALGLLPLILIGQGAALLLGIEPSANPIDFQGAGFVLHVGLAIVGLQGFAVAFAAGSLYLIQHHELKSKRFGRLFSFIPPLATLDRVGLVSAWSGLVALTLALALGWAWTVQNRGSLEMTDPKVIWAIGVWAVLLGVILARRGKSRSDHRSALAAVLGFALVIGAYLAIRLTAGSGGVFL